MNKQLMIRSGALALSLLATSVLAAVSPQEAQQLGTSLTPVGGEKAGNADGSIPAWTGGLKPGAAPVDAKGFLSDPYASEKPLFTITAANAEQYKDKLTPGQLAMFKRYPEIYKMPVYKTERSAAIPEEIAALARKSAVSTELTEDGNGLRNFTDTRYYPFPIPKSGVEVYWNHTNRYRGGNMLRQAAQAAPQTNGDYSIVEYNDELAYPQYMKDAKPEQTGNIFYYYKQEITAPARMAGSVVLVHETIDQVKEPRKAWVYNAGQRRVRAAPQIAYDGPGAGSDGLRTADNTDLMNGAPDRYDWKLLGKKEIYIPYNNYKLQSPSLKYADIIKPGHIDQSLARYELHRVWHVEATLRASQRHIYAKRDLYIDEDTWQIAEVDHYDGRGQLWRVGEGYAFNDYERGAPTYAMMGIYDLIAGRYNVLAMTNESKHATVYGKQTAMVDFTPAALRQAGIR